MDEGFGGRRGQEFLRRVGRILSVSVVFKREI